MRNLNIGAGLSPKLKFISLDLFVWPDATDLQADARRLPFGDLTFNIIYSRATLEHIPSWETMKALSEWFRVLRIGGAIQIVVPDLVRIFRRWLIDETIDETYALALIYGGCKRPDSRYVEFQDHTTGFTHERLGRMMGEVGFVDVERAYVWTTPILEMRGRRRD